MSASREFELKLEAAIGEHKGPHWTGPFCCLGSDTVQFADGAV
jgi:hypothetical protein